MYNLIVNNESYGDKRLTPLFEDYIKNKLNLGNEFLHFSTLVDSKKIDLFATQEVLDNVQDEEILLDYERSQVNNILFAAFHARGKLNTPGKGRLMELVNSNFPVNTRMKIMGYTDTIVHELGTKITSLIRSKNLIINYKCI